MLAKIYLFLIAFLSIAMVFGVYLGYTLNFNVITAGLSLALSLIFSFLIVNHTSQKYPEIITVKFESQKNKFLLAGILLLFIILNLWMVLPAFVVPNSCSDLMNHSTATRVDAKLGHFTSGALDEPTFIPLVFIHSFPQGLYAVSSQLYLIFNISSYSVLTILGILLELLLIIGIFIISKKHFSESVAVISAFICAFTITNLWILEAGYLPQLFGTVFFIAGIYFFFERNFLLKVLSVIGLIAYFPFFLVFILFIILVSISKESLKENLIQLLFPIATASIIVFPEVLGLVTKWFITSPQYLLVVRGGIPVPNPFEWLIFIFGGIPTFAYLSHRLLKKQINEDLFTVSKFHYIFHAILALLFVMGAVVLYFLINYFIFSLVPQKQITQVYMAVKLFYLLLVILSIPAALGIQTFLQKYNRFSAKVLVAGVLAFHLVLFATYIPHIQLNESFPPEFYSIAEKIDSLPPEFFLGVDQEFVKTSQFYFPGFFHKSFFDWFEAPSSQIVSYCRKFQIGRALNFWWANYELGENEIIITNDAGEKVLKIGMEDVDYYLTQEQSHPYPVVFREGSLVLYQLRDVIQP